MLELKAKTIAGPARTEARAERQQPRRLALALVLLLAALGGVLWHDRQFWFGTDQSVLDADATDSAASPRAVAKSVPSQAKPAKPVTGAKATAAKKQAPVGTASTETKPEDSPVVTANRTVLPPLDVEVVAGDNHRKVHPGSNSTKVEITNPAAADHSQLATNAAERERISASIVEPRSYPLLAQQMKVQGSVVLQALIGADGVIQNIHVLSGPAILSSAAQQAVREWRFKPIIENGQAVESKAKITVNFTIKIADGSSKTTLAESRPLTIESLSR